MLWGGTIGPFALVNAHLQYAVGMHILSAEDTFTVDLVAVLCRQ